MLQITTILFVVALSVLAGIHFIAEYLFLYWKFPWLDIPVHFFGGTIIVLGLFTLRDFKIIPKSWLHRVPVFLLSLVVILGWEVFILFAGKVIDDTFISDTVIDITVGLLGVLVGYYIANSIRHV